jgi:DNA-directed RNA polymerase specialized sigma24 family protein
VTLLSRPWPLWDIDDIEAYSRDVVAPLCGELSYHEREDLVTFCIETAWQFSLEFRPELGVHFTRFLRPRLRNKAVDEIRRVKKRTTWKFKGRVHQRKLPQFVALDDSLAETLPALAGDPAADRDPDFERLLHEGARRRDEDFYVLDLEPPCRAA